MHHMSSADENLLVQALHVPVAVWYELKHSGCNKGILYVFRNVPGDGWLRDHVDGVQTNRGRIINLLPPTAHNLCYIHDQLRLGF